MFFQEITVVGVPALFSCGRLDNNTIPKGYSKYSLRHDDLCKGEICQVMYCIIVNHWADIIVRDPLDKHDRWDTKWYCIDLVETEDIVYYAGNCRTMQDFMEKYPI